MNPIRYLRDAFFTGERLNLRVGVYRLGNQFKTKVWNKRERLLCLVIGHKSYEIHDWGGGYLKCERCYKTLKVLWKPKYSNKAGKDN